MPCKEEDRCALHVAYSISCWTIMIAVPQKMTQNLTGTVQLTQREWPVLQGRMPKLGYGNRIGHSKFMQGYSTGVCLYIQYGAKVLGCQRKSCWKLFIRIVSVYLLWKLPNHWTIQINRYTIKSNKNFSCLWTILIIDIVLVARTWFPNFSLATIGISFSVLSNFTTSSLLLIDELNSLYTSWGIDEPNKVC